MRTLAAVLVLALATTGCRRSVVHTAASASTGPDTLIAGTVITSAGTWSAITSRGRNELDLTVSGTTISWKVKYGPASGGSGLGMTLSSPSDPWFVYVESPSRLWTFNGKDQLDYCFQNSPGRGGKNGTCILSRAISPGSPPVPADLVPHLPAELRKLFPEVEAADKRPSI